MDYMHIVMVKMVDKVINFNKVSMVVDYMEMVDKTMVIVLVMEATNK